MPPKRVRTRQGSCWPCKDRRVLCDLRKPTCEKCGTSGRTCEYGTVRLRWDNGVASRGRLAGQNVPIASSQALSLVNSQPTEWHVSYFENQVLPLFSLTTPEALAVDITAFALDPALSEAMKAVASSHRMYSGGARSHDALVNTKRQKHSAIAAFRRQFLAGDFNRLAPALFAANVLLCIHDGMIHPAAEDAATLIHYQGGKAILSRWDARRDPLASQSGTLSRLLSIFATMDLTYAVLSGDEPYFDREWWNFFIGKEAWWTGLHDDRPFIKVMGLFAEMARLSYKTRQPGGEPVPIETLLLLQKELQIMSNRIGEAELTQVSPQSANFVLCYRMAAYIYMYRVLCNMPSDDQNIQNSVMMGLHAVSGKNAASEFSHCQIFPGLIIGAHCLEEFQKEEIRHLIDGAGNALSFGSVELMHNFLRLAWRQGRSQMNWTELFRPVAKMAFLF